MRPTQFIHRGALVAAILIIQSGYAQQADRVCDAPRYKVASLDTKKDKPGEVSISVSIAPKTVSCSMGAEFTTKPTALLDTMLVVTRMFPEYAFPGMVAEMLVSLQLVTASETPAILT
jgi:hypothetical protein